MLFSPLTLGELELPNRLVMAPLTRVRTGEEGVPGPLVAEHYSQRASLGLIVSEGIYPSPAGRAYSGQPGIVTAGQIAGWKKVTDAVHAEGGRYSPRSCTAAACRTRTSRAARPLWAQAPWPSTA